MAVQLLSVIVLTFSLLPPVFADEDTATTSEAVFNERILPIFRSEKPSSCVQCHLSSVDLKNYILPSSQKTFLSLRDQGLIDFEQPEKSKILKLIQMGDRDLDTGAKLIHAKLRKQEYDAFAAWIRVCCENESLRKLPKLSEEELAGPGFPDQVIRHSRKSRVVESFARNVFSQRMRCFPCHTPHEIDENNPRHAAAIKTRSRLQEKYGDQIERLNLFKKTPEATLDFLVQASRQPRSDSLPMLNLEDAKRSLLVMKPTSKLPARNSDGSFASPSYLPPVSHMGGLKMHPHDQSYKSFIAWIEDYAKTTKGEYQSVEDLPADNWIPTQLVLRLSKTPKEWSPGTPVQLFLHPQNENRQGWQDKPIAFTQGTVTPRGMVNGALFVFKRGPQRESEPKADSQQSSLPNAAYQVRVYVDRTGQLTDDPAAMLTGDAYVGSIEFDGSGWQEGFRSAKTVSAEALKH